MGRPLTGSKIDGKTRFGFSLPAARGSTQRIERWFDTAADRDAWAAWALEALRAGQPVPDPDTADRPAPLTATPGFREVAERWFAKEHVLVPRSQAGRSEDVRRTLDNHLLPWFGPRLARTIGDLSREMVLDWQRAFLDGETRRNGHKTALLTATATGELLTRREISERFGVSKSRLQRLAGRGAFPHAQVDDHGVQRIPLADLAAAGLMTDVAQPRMHVSTMKNARGVLRQIAIYAQGNGIDLPVDAVFRDLRISSADAHPGEPAPGPAGHALTWPESARVAAQLHVIWQFVFWLLRALGLRISEAFGLHVDSILRLPDDTAWLSVERQGGRSFKLRDSDGARVSVAELVTLKRDASVRLLRIPAPVLALIDQIIAVFHTTPDGTIDTDARLIPSIAGGGGQAGFRAALTVALHAAGLNGLTDVTAHDLRKSLTTDLAVVRGADDDAARLYVGHDLGDDTFARHYIIRHVSSDHPLARKVGEVAEDIERVIRTELGGDLMIPTRRKIGFQSGGAHFERREDIHERLVACGWMAADIADDATILLSTEEVAARLGVPAKAVRALTDRGALRRVVTGRHGNSHLIDEQSVADYQKQRVGLVTLTQVADNLGQPYHRLYQAIRSRHAQRITPIRFDGDPTIYLSTDQVGILRDEAERLAALRDRALPLNEAAARCGISASTARKYVQQGRLVADPETDPSGTRYITRSSIDAYLAACVKVPARRAKRSLTTSDCITASDLTRLSGLTLYQLGELERHGILKAQGAARTLRYTLDSVQRWAIGYRPDLLDVIAVQAHTETGTETAA